jgi:hypothetical protein
MLLVWPYFTTEADEVVEIKASNRVLMSRRVLVCCQMYLAAVVFRQGGLAPGAFSLKMSYETITCF